MGVEEGPLHWMMDVDGSVTEEEPQGRGQNLERSIFLGME